MANQAPNFRDENKLTSKQREILRYNEEINERKKSLSQKKSINHKNLLKKAAKEVFSKKPDEQGAEVPLRHMPDLTKQKNESHSAFLNRIDKVTKCFFISSN